MNLQCRSFAELQSSVSWDDIRERIASTSAANVERALAKRGERSLDDFLALVSPAAKPYLEGLARESQRITQRRFGKTIQLYAPLYLSNECSNICTYCGFSYTNKIERLTLNEEQILAEAEAVRDLGFEHVLLVSGEAPRTVNTDYFERAIKLLTPLFAQISLEVQPLSAEEYRRLRAAGLYSVLVYQETYHSERYRLYHPKGKKSNFHYRLETPERAGDALIHKIGIGALLGLEDWRTESWFVAFHLAYLRKRFWRSRFSISFPRLRPAEGFTEPRSVLDEADLVQLIAAYRLFDENVELSLSTRERPEFRDHVFPLGITSMSAGSRTDPGGYAVNKRALKQFVTSDERSPAEVARMIASRGYEPVWKDWDNSLFLSEPRVA